MADLPVAGYLSDAARTQAEVKASLEAFVAATRQLPGAGGAVTTLTIASGSITPTLGEHLVDTEAAAASDDLANVAQTNIPDGRLLMLRCANATRVVVVKHGAGGTGQISIGDGADFSLLDPSMWLVLRREGALWTEVFRSYGNQGAALRTRYDLATLTAAANTFTKTQQWAQGANIASASTLTLGADGNRFNVTGAVGITAISAKPVGTRILLEFASTPQFTHHASNLKLQNAQNFTAAAGDELEFVSIGSGQWKEINRHLVAQTTGFEGSPVTHLQSDWEDFRGTSDGQTYTPPLNHPGNPWVIAPQVTGLTVLSDYRGVIRMASDATGIAPFVVGGSAFAVSQNPTIYLRWAQRTATAATRKIGGIGSSPSAADPSLGVYFRHTAGGNIIAVCASSGESTLDTAVPTADGVFHTGRLVITGTTSVAVYVDEILKGTITANIPTGALTPWFASTANVVTVGLDVDYFVVSRPR